MTIIKFKIISIWVQIRDLYLYLFRQAIIVNAWIDDHTWKDLNHRNWGDDINYYFIKTITGRPVVSIYNFRFARRFKFKNYLCIGSLLGMPGYTNKNTIVWGAGSFGELKGVIPKHICSVRGKLTRNILSEKGIECPDIYGDPALLLPKYYRPPTTSRQHFILGIIPHVEDLNHPVVEEIRKEHSEILIIDLAHYKKWTDVIDQICSCNMILSSSLHGLIVSDAYGIANCWIELSGNILGGYFKFYDYASSVERYFSAPIHIGEFTDVADVVDNAASHFSCADAEKIKELQQGLITAAPFECFVLGEGEDISKL